MNSLAKLLVYLPQVSAKESNRQFVRSLVANAKAENFAVTLVTPGDAGTAFEQLQKLAPSHDLLYLPQPMGVLPPKARLLLPIPILMDFDELPVEMEHLIEVGTRFFFPTELLRFRAVRERGIAAHRTRVIAPDDWETFLFEARAVLRLGDKAYLPYQVKSSFPRDKRIAWLIEDAQLRNTEVPLLRELGYEVFTNSEYSWDRGTTLPTTAIELLNAFPFSKNDFDPELVATLNAHFGTIIAPAHPPLIHQLVEHFHSGIYIRLLNHGELSFLASPGLWKRCWEIQRRLWFAGDAAAIPPFEQRLLRDRFVDFRMALHDGSLHLPMTADVQVARTSLRIDLERVTRTPQDELRDLVRLDLSAFTANDSAKALTLHREEEFPPPPLSNLRACVKNPAP